MLSWIREKFGTVVIGGIIGFIAFVFVFYGVFSPKATRGLHEGAVAGMVNGDPIKLDEFNREFKRKVELFKSFAGGGGGGLTEEQIKAFRVREMVFEDLARRKVLLQQVSKQNMMVSDEQIRDSIREIPAFQKDGHFDVLKYKQVLEANQYSAGGFERLMRDDLSTQQWDAYFARRSWVTNDELRREFLLTQEKRKIKYVLLTHESGKKLVSVDAAEVQKFLADSAKLGMVKSQFESGKANRFKGKEFDAVKAEIAQELISGGKFDQIQKANTQLANQLKEVLTASASSDAKVKALLKPVGLDVKTSDWLTRQSAFIPGVGEVQDFLKDAFGNKDPNAAQVAKSYSVASGLLVAIVVESQKADLAQFDAQREKLARELNSRKQREFYQNWLGELMKKAKIDRNPAIFASEQES